MKESCQNNSVEDISKKVSKLNIISSLTQQLKLPSVGYGPFCMKILQEFISHNNLSNDLPLPNVGDKTHDALSKIFDIILHSMGEEKRNQILLRLDEYNMSVTDTFRK